MKDSPKLECHAQENDNKKARNRRKKERKKQRRKDKRWVKTDNDMNETTTLMPENKEDSPTTPIAPNVAKEQKEGWSQRKDSQELLSSPEDEFFNETDDSTVEWDSANETIEVNSDSRTLQQAFTLRLWLPRM